MRILSYGLTDRGLIRQRNEDSLLVDDVNRVYAVADGLGGLPRGALASSLAISKLEEIASSPRFRGEPDFKQVFRTINDRVRDEGQKISGEIGIGTTLTVAFFRGSELTLAHVGDSALFLMRDGDMRQLTRDHTMEQDLLDRMTPEEKLRAVIPEYFAHTLTRCIGQQDELDCDLEKFEIQKGDRLLLVSDGVTKTHTDEEIAVHLGSSSSPEVCSVGFIHTANERGGPDNTTAVSLFIE